MINQVKEFLRRADQKLEETLERFWGDKKRATIAILSASTAIFFVSTVLFGM